MGSNSQCADQSWSEYLTAAGGRLWRRLNKHLPPRTRADWSRGSTVTGPILVDDCRWLAEVSGSQSCKMALGEDMLSSCSPGVKRHITSITAAFKNFLWRWLTSCRGRWRYSNCQMNWFWKDGTISFESAVLQITSWTCVHLLTRWGSHFLLLQFPALLFGSCVLEPNLHHFQRQVEFGANGFTLQTVWVGTGLITGLQNGEL